MPSRWSQQHRTLRAAPQKLASIVGGAYILTGGGRGEYRASGCIVQLWNHVDDLLQQRVMTDEYRISILQGKNMGKEKRLTVMMVTQR